MMSDLPVYDGNRGPGPAGAHAGHHLQPHNSRVHLLIQGHNIGGQNIGREQLASSPYGRRLILPVAKVLILNGLDVFFLLAQLVAELLVVANRLEGEYENNHGQSGKSAGSDQAEKDPENEGEQCVLDRHLS